MRSCPTRKCLAQRKDFECSWTDGGRHSGPCLLRGAQRDSVGVTDRARVVQLLEIEMRTDAKV